MGRFTEIALPQNFIDYSRKLPEELLYKAAQDLDKKIAETDALAAGINKLFDIKIAPSQQSQEDYKRITSSYIKEKNDIINTAIKDPSNIAQHNARIKQLASRISDDATAGQLKALKDQGEQYWGNVAAKQTTYKDQPELYNFWKNKLDKNLTNKMFNSDLMTYGNIEEPQMFRNVDPKEVENWVGDAYKRIAVEENIDEMQLRRLISTNASNISALSGKDKIAAEKIMAVLKAVPQEFVNSFQQYNEATGFKYPNSEETVNENLYWDAATNSFNKATRLGSMLNSAVIGGAQNKTQLINAPIAQPRSSSGDGSSNKEPKSIHTWSIHPAINTLLAKRDTAIKTNPADTDTISGFDNLIKQSVDDITDQVLNVEYWKDNIQYKNMFENSSKKSINPLTGAPVANSNQSQIVKPFVKHRVGTKERPNVFEPDDFIINFGEGTKGKVYIRNKTAAPTSYVNPRLGDYTVSNNTVVKTRVFDLDNPEHVRKIKEIVLLDGFIPQNFGQAKSVALQNFDEPENEQ